jgi:hypothetical protein
MTLTRYIGLYIFNPIVLWITRRRVARGQGVFRRATATVGGFLEMVLLPTVFTMALAGIWHGAGLQFLICGLLHASYLSINHAWRTFGPREAPRSSVAAAVIVAGQVSLTFLAVLVGQIFFRADSTASALTILAEISGLHGVAANGADLPAVNIHGSQGQLLHAARLVALFVVCWTFPNTQQIMARFSPTLSKFEPGPARWRWEPTVAWGVAIAFLFLATLAGRIGDPARFLYFQF